jgi:hypothetical protein
MKKRQSAWRILAYALGPKTGRNEKEADIIAFVRTVILISYMTTNFFIVAGVIRQWPRASCTQSMSQTTPVMSEPSEPK